MKLKDKRKKRYFFSTIFLAISILLSCIFFWSVGANDTTTTDNSTTRAYRNVAYFTSWCGYERAIEVGDMDPSLLTHINFAFANLSSNGTISVGDPWIDIQKPFGDDTWETELRGHFGRLIKLKEQYPHIKTLISVGGWTWSTNFSEVAASDALRKTCAQSAVDFVVKYGFDGVDLDWEYPVEGGNNISHRPDDGNNYILLLKEIRTALDEQSEKDGKKYLLSIAGGANPSFVANCKVGEMMQYLDYINVMTYDYHGTWETTTNHATPLYANSEDPTGSTLCVSDTIDKYIAAGVEPADLNLGLAFYGKGWVNVTDTNGSGLYKRGEAAVSAGYGSGTFEGSSFEYWDIEANYYGKNNYKRYWDETAKVPYLYNGSTFITYEDQESIAYKLEYIKDMGLGGAMFWEFSYDKNLTLQNVVAKTLRINEAGTAPGDVNGDGLIDSIDFAVLKSFLLGRTDLTNREPADVNIDGSIDALDLTKLKLILLGKSFSDPNS